MIIIITIIILTIIILTIIIIMITTAKNFLFTT